MSRKDYSRETLSYRLSWDGLSGTSIIIRKSDDTTTLRNTGTDALDEARMLNRFSYGRFDEYCSELEYTP